MSLTASRLGKPEGSQDRQREGLRAGIRAVAGGDLDGQRPGVGGRRLDGQLLAGNDELLQILGEGRAVTTMETSTSTFIDIRKMKLKGGGN